MGARVESVLLAVLVVVMGSLLTAVILVNGNRVDASGHSHPGAAAAATPNAAAASSHVHTVAAPGGHGHNIDETAELQPDKPLDRATRDQLASQLVAARDVALRYPTVADVTAAGYRLAGGFAPGVGAHYVAFSAAGLSGSGPIDVNKVNSFIYDGTSPTSHIVGLMYYGMSNTQPEGFAGPNDHWHRHQGVCIQPSPLGLNVPFPADADVTKQQCDGVHGTYLARTGWMVHAWVVPGWESPAGVFSHSNPNLHCADGTDHTDKAGFCAGT